jgi:hypothetical protein
MSGVAMVVGSCGNFEISQLIYLRESFWRSYNLFFTCHNWNNIAHSISQILEVWWWGTDSNNLPTRAASSLNYLFYLEAVGGGGDCPPSFHQ